MTVGGVLSVEAHHMDRLGHFDLRHGPSLLGNSGPTGCPIPRQGAVAGPRLGYAQRAANATLS